MVRRVISGTRLEIDHHHDDLEFNLVIRGAGLYRIEQRAYVLKPGTLIWLTPGLQHSLCRSPQLEMWVVVVRPELVEAECLRELSNNPSRLVPDSELIDLDTLLSQVAQDSDDPAVYNAGVIYALRRAWRISRAQVAQHKAMHPAVTRALLQLRRQEASHSLVAVAAHAGVTAPYLSRLLIEQTGRGFVEWRNRTRLERFMTAWQPGDNLLNTALDVGFGSYAQFHRIFTQLVGCSPAEWVKRPTGEQIAAADLTPLGAGLPAAMALSRRQRWTAILGAVSPSLPPLLATGFLRRVLQVTHGSAPVTQGSSRLDATLPAAERARFLKDLGLRDPQRAQEFRDLLDTHDFSGVLAWILPYYGLSSASLADAVTALLMIVWVAATRSADPPIAQVQAVNIQVRQALEVDIARLRHDMAQAALTALLCHFVVAYHALQATRASGDPRETEQLAVVALTFGRTAFDGDLAALTLSGRGFIADRTSQRRVSSRSRRP